MERMKRQNLMLLLAEGFRQRGFVVEEIGGESAEVGVDLVLSKGQQRFFVHCGQWKAASVDVDTVQELHDVVAARNAAGGFLVTSGRFTPDATALARAHKLEIIDAPALAVLLDQADESITTGIRVSKPAR
jgi:restriction system protein